MFTVFIPRFPFVRWRELAGEFTLGRRRGEPIVSESLLPATVTTPARPLIANSKFPSLECGDLRAIKELILAKIDSGKDLILILFTAFGAVFVAEIVGDKLLYTTGVLAARYRTVPIMIGMATAFMGKMGVAVIVGSAISKLPPALVATITALSFLGVALALWRKSDRPRESNDKHRASKAAMVSFAAIFFSEWGDCWPDYRGHARRQVSSAVRCVGWCGGRYGNERRARSISGRRYSQVD